MQLAFYRGRGDWITRFIRWWTRGAHSHVEIVFSSGVRFGASGRDGLGVAFRAPLAADERGDWDLIPVALSSEHELRLLRACDAIRGRAFDWVGLFGYLLPRPRRYSCAELVVELCWSQLGMRLDRWATPADLYRIFKERNEYETAAITAGDAGALSECRCRGCGAGARAADELGLRLGG